MYVKVSKWNCYYIYFIQWLYGKKWLSLCKYNAYTCIKIYTIIYICGAQPAICTQPQSHRIILASLIYKILGMGPDFGSKTVFVLHIKWMADWAVFSPEIGSLSQNYNVANLARNNVYFFYLRVGVGLEGVSRVINILCGITMANLCKSYSYNKYSSHGYIHISHK